MKTKKDALIIPLASVIKENNSDCVYTINGNKATLTPIITGITDGTSIEVKSGLNPGDKVVTVGMSNLKNGTVVIVTNK